MHKKINFFDTTLRDGEQGIGNTMSISQKFAIIEEIEKLNIDIIELGFPAASPEDTEWVKQVAKLRLKAKPCVFTRAKHNDIAITLDAISHLTNPQVQILIVGSEIHLIKKRNMVLAESLAEISSSIAQLKAAGIADIAVILEDSLRGSFELVKQTVQTAVDAGATTVSLADTVGCALPDDVALLVAKIRKLIGSDITLSVHCHNDMGLATANSLAACKAGADVVQTTIGGIGERAGNCSLEELAAIIHYKGEEMGLSSAINIQQLPQATKSIFDILASVVPGNKPIVGENVFSTSAGIHQNGLIKNPEIYEYVKPHDFGRDRQMVFSRLSGISYLSYVLSRDRNDAVLINFYNYLMKFRKNLSHEEVLEIYKEFLAEHSYEV
jgi:2-isopropylmalate synthase